MIICIFPLEPACRSANLDCNCFTAADQIRGDEIEMVEARLSLLNAEERALVEARVFEEESYGSLSKRYGKTEASLRKWYQRIMDKLRPV